MVSQSLSRTGRVLTWSGVLVRGVKAQVGEEEISAGEELAVELGNWLQTGKLVK